MKVPYLLVGNKLDLLSKEELAELKNEYPEAVFVSAQAKINLEEIEQRIIDFVT